MRKLTLSEAIKRMNENIYEMVVGDRYVEFYEKKTGKLVLTVTRKYFNTQNLYS
mgnify:CR=1 FL=1